MVPSSLDFPFCPPEQILQVADNTSLQGKTLDWSSKLGEGVEHSYMVSAGTPELDTSRGTGKVP